MVMTNEAAQRTLLEAEEVLERALEAEATVGYGRREAAPRLQFLLAALRCVRVYSASGNSIPGLGGLGLQEAAELAAELLSGPPPREATVRVSSLAPALKAVEVKS